MAAFALVKALGAADVIQASAAAGGLRVIGTGTPQQHAGLQQQGTPLSCSHPARATLAGDVLSLDVIGNSALYAAQCTLLFGFAAAALEAGFTNGWVRRMAGTIQQ